MENFRAIRDEFIARGALRQITANCENRSSQKEQLLEVFRELLQNAQARESLGRAALAVIENNRGAADKIADNLLRIHHRTSVAIPGNIHYVEKKSL